MNNLIHLLHRGDGRKPVAMRRTFLLALGLLTLGLPSVAPAAESPRGKEIFGGNRAMATGTAAPSPKVLRVVWSYPVSLETPDLIFKLYHSTNLALPLGQWSLLTNIPGFVRDVRIVAGQAQEYFVLTASNYLGESGYAGP